MNNCNIEFMELIEILLLLLDIELMLLKIKISYDNISKMID